MPQGPLIPSLGADAPSQVWEGFTWRSRGAGLLLHAGRAPFLIGLLHIRPWRLELQNSLTSLSNAESFVTMALSLAPIIKESVTKPNVSLTQARRGKARERSEGAGTAARLGRGSARHPKSRSWAGGASLERRGESRGWGSGHRQGCPAWRRCQGVPGLAEPGRFPTPRRTEVPLVGTSPRAGREEGILRKAQPTSQRQGENPSRHSPAPHGHFYPMEPLDGERQGRAEAAGSPHSPGAPAAAGGPQRVPTPRAQRCSPPCHRPQRPELLLGVAAPPPRLSVTRN